MTLEEAIALTKRLMEETPERTEYRNRLVIALAALNSVTPDPTREEVLQEVHEWLEQWPQIASVFKKQFLPEPEP